MTRPRLFLLTASAAIAVALTSPVQAQGLYPQWEISLQRLLSGLKVSGSQSSATALQTTNAHKAAAEAAASTLVSQDNALRLARAQHRYGYDTGTGYAACDVALMTSEESDSYASEGEGAPSLPRGRPALAQRRRRRRRAHGHQPRSAPDLLLLAIRAGDGLVPRRPARRLRRGRLRRIGMVAEPRLRGRGGDDGRRLHRRSSPPCRQ